VEAAERCAGAARPAQLNKMPAHLAFIFLGLKVKWIDDSLAGFNSLTFKLTAFTK